MSDYKECPYCAEQILVKAIKCKHCHSMLEESPAEEIVGPSAPPEPAKQAVPSAPPPPPQQQQQQQSAPPPSPGLEKKQAVSPPPPLKTGSDPTPGTASTSPLPPPPSAGDKQAAPPPPPMQAKSAATPPPSPPPAREKQAATQPSPPPKAAGSSTPGGSPPPPPPTGARQQNATPGPAPATGLTAPYPKAALGKRIMAYLIDFVIGFVPIGIMMAIMSVLVASAASADPFGEPPAALLVLTVVTYIVGWGWAVFYFLLRDGFGRGQSIGKKAFKLMVVRLEDGRPGTKGNSAVRNLIASFLGVIDMIIALVHEKGHRLGDILVKTQVIETHLYRQ